MVELIRDYHFSKVKNYIIEFRNKYREIDILITNLESYGELILIGGAIRDLALYDKEPRDFDIIVNTDYSFLHEAFTNFEFTRNRFGGYKVSLDKFNFDIWGIQDNWAFKNYIFETKMENIKEGTFYNFDSILFSLNSDYRDAKYFNDAIENNVLDILLEKKHIDCNPTPEINIARALVIKKQWKLNFSPKVCNYIFSWCSNTKKPVKTIKQALRKHYGCENYLSNKEIQNMLQVAIELRQ